MDGGRDRLSRELPIPKGWSELEMVDDCVDIAGVQVHRAGISSRNSSGIEVTGSAAARGGSPLRRAWLELLERMAIVDSGVSSSDDPRRRRPGPTAWPRMRPGQRPARARGSS